MEMWRENENENKIKLFHYKIWKKKNMFGLSLNKQLPY